MIGDITRWIMTLMQEHGSMTVFVGVIIESVIVPIPSPLIIMGAGALLIPPGLGWTAFYPIVTKIVIPGAIASTLGAYLMYGAGYGGGKPLVDKCHGFLGFTWEDLLAFEKRHLSRRTWWMLFALRALPIVPLSLVSAAAGAVRLPFWGFTWATLLGAIPRCLFLGALGYLTRDSYEGLAGKMNKLESVVSGLIVLGACALVLWLRRRMKH